MAEAARQRENVVAFTGGPRRGLSHTEAARYVGVGTTKFDEMVRDRRMPSPRRIDGRVIWDIRELDEAFDNLPHDLAGNAWDAVR